MNILFIGGSGNISADCAALLYERGHKIFVITRGHIPLPKTYTALVADRRDRAALCRTVQDIPADVVVNFTGFTPLDVEIDYELFAGKIRQYIFISSASVYAKPHRKIPLTEASPLGNPFSEYAQNKQACEEWLLARAGASGFPVTIVRPSHTYSCRWIPNPVSSTGYTLVARLEQGKPVFIHDDGQGLWTLTATTDFAVGLAGLVGREDTTSEVFHITSDEVLTWNQIYAEICRAAGVAGPEMRRIPTDFICKVSPLMTAKLKGDKAEPGVFDNAKIKRFVPEFECRKSFRRGIAEAILWFRSEPGRMRIEPWADAVFEQVIAAWESCA
jgi:nucleoside-diphosphate-sugar epimerase